MKKLIISSTIIMLIMFGLYGASPVLALSIGLNPASGTIAPGEDLNVTLFVEGLGSYEAPSLGGYDVDIYYDPLILNFTSVSFGPYLGYYMDFGDDMKGSSADVAASGGTLNIAEVSFLLPYELDALQPDTFELATISFVGAAPDVAISTFSSRSSQSYGYSLELSVNALSDALGGSIQPVPEPATLLLFGVGLAGLAGFGRKKFRKR